MDGLDLLSIAVELILGAIDFFYSKEDWWEGLPGLLLKLVSLLERVDWTETIAINSVVAIVIKRIISLVLGNNS